MGICRCLYVEVRGPDGWDIPAEPQPEDGDRRKHGEFACVREGKRWWGLFWSKDAIFRMRQGPPPEVDRSPLLNHHFEWQLDQDESGLCWIPYEDLATECWDELDLLVHSYVPVRHVQKFGDGRQRFPRDQLWEAGVDERQIDEMRSGWIASEPIDNRRCRYRSDLAKLPPDRKADVTWMESISDYIGAPWASRFKGLARYGRPSDIRVLSTRG